MRFYRISQIANKLMNQSYKLFFHKEMYKQSCKQQQTREQRCWRQYLQTAKKIVYQACSTSSCFKHSKLIHKSFKEPSKVTVVVIVFMFFFSFIVALVAVSDIIIIFIVAVTILNVVVIIFSGDCFSCVRQRDNTWIDMLAWNCFHLINVYVSVKFSVFYMMVTGVWT